MFKKLKDKLAEEVKSSPQRIQQFAQAAQAAVTSASSSISDITNNDLFSIGDSDRQTSQENKELVSSSIQVKTHDVSSVERATMSHNSDMMDFVPPNVNERQRKLSNSSFASDISFRLPSFESTSMFHLQSDMEVSASEAEERGLSGGIASLDRVSKEQLYAAYRRTRERYAKYRTQYADLARHYKLLERENAKAKSVLVETQDKALRRISELKEQSVLEQSAKVHLEKSLRLEIDEREMKIESLNSKINVLLNQKTISKTMDVRERDSDEAEKELIDLSLESLPKHNDKFNSEISNLNSKIEKLEHLVTKYKESLKSTKEKNSLMTSEIQLLSSEFENKKKECEQLKFTAAKVDEAEKKIQDLNDVNEQLQNKLNSYDFNKTKELTTLETDLKSAQEEINKLQTKINAFTKKEEEYAISLAENKLSIHKELESKESEIKSLKDSLSACRKEIQSLNIVLIEYKNNIAALEEEKEKLKEEVKELYNMKDKIKELETQIHDETQKSNMLELSKAKSDEDYKCYQLQLKQETAEKLAMIDRNTYLESRNSQLMEENSKKTSQLNDLSKQLETLKSEAVADDKTNDDLRLNEIKKESDMWKIKYDNLELEMQSEKVELDKLQADIEKLLENHENIQRENDKLRSMLTESKDYCLKLERQMITNNSFVDNIKETLVNVSQFKKEILLLHKDVQNLKMLYEQKLTEMNQILTGIFKDCVTATDYIAIRDQFKNELKEKLELTTTINKTKEESTRILSENYDLKKEAEDLRTKINQLQTSIIEKEETISNFNVKYNDCLNELHTANNEIIKMTQKQEEISHSYKNLQKVINLSQSEKQTTEKETELNNKKLSDEINQYKIDNLSLNRQLEEIKEQHINQTQELTKLTESNKDFVETFKNYEKKVAYISELEGNIRILSDNNLSLKSQSENIATNVKQLQNEIEEIRRSHTELEIEKNRLNVEIQKLESNQCQHKNIIKVDSTNQTEETQSENHQEKTSFNSELLELLKNENEVQREENKRLQSDIEGLQTYLSKVSKENSVLNDKLREIIASSEISVDNEDDLTDLQNEIQTSKERIDDLLRENTLLVEENLELKDQLQLQNSPLSNNNSKIEPTISSEYVNLESKYKSLLDSKNNLESRLNDMNDENRSVIMNIDQLQADNAKLRLTNEKLERRLDEALVSLRHLHSLQDNSELEYLRNILYEYLTGSGTHSLTLAKVLAAVVKFSDAQTQQVLLKEKERQGLLGHLGLF